MSPIYGGYVHDISALWRTHLLR